MNQHTKGRLGLILVTIIWGTSFAMNDIALQSFSPHQLICLRFTLAFILMTVIYFKEVRNIRKKVLLKGIIMGIILYLAYVLQTVALVYTTPSKNAFLTSFNVILVPLISALFFKEKIKMKNIVGAFVSLIGIMIMSLTDLSHINTGDILTLCCAIFFALHIIYTNKYATNENPVLLNTIQMGTAAILSMLATFFEKEPWNFTNYSANLSIIYLAAICTMLAYLLQTASQRYTTQTEAAVILSLESVFGMIFSIIIVHEVITLKTFLGASLILLGVFIVELNIKKSYSSS